MTNLSDLQIEQASHSELVMMVRLLLARVESLEKEVQMLREVNERLKHPKSNSRNSSQPPSRYQKPNFSNDQSKKKHGPPFGHNRMIGPSADLTLNGFHRRVAEIGNRLDRLHREKLLTFLDYPDVLPTNNASEQAIRTSVIHRKVTNGFRSEWGAKAYAELLSVISASKIKCKKVFETLVNLMGSEVIPFLHA